MSLRSRLSKFYGHEMTDIEKEKAKRKSKIYVTTIQILFGIIIGMSFTDYHTTLIPYRFNFETSMILLAYATVLVSLVGYSITIKERYHINFVRFLLDVLLLYIYYQLVYSPLYGFRTFLVNFPLIFNIYIVWQLLEYFEWRNDKKNPYRENPFLLTIFGTMGFLGCFLAIMIFYNGAATVEDVGILKYSSVGLAEKISLALILTLILAFRVFIAYVESKEKTSSIIKS
jgi:hypothetical protein